MDGDWDQVRVPKNARPSIHLANDHSGSHHGLVSLLLVCGAKGEAHVHALQCYSCHTSRNEADLCARCRILGRLHTLPASGRQGHGYTRNYNDIRPSAGASLDGQRLCMCLRHRSRLPRPASDSMLGPCHIILRFRLDQIYLVQSIHYTWRYPADSRQ